MEQIAIRLDEPRRLEFRRFLIASGVIHVLMFGMLVWSPSLSSMSPPAAVIVDLTLALPSAATKPGPAARPKPKPKPPRKAPVVLPTQPSVPKPQAKPKPAPPQEEPEEVEYEDLMAKLRADAGEPDPAAEPDEDPVETASIGGGGGPGVPVSPELAAWMRASRIHVRRSWVVPPDFEFQTLVVEIAIELDGSGNVLGTTVKRRSGSPYYDDNVISSIKKASPLPAPPEAGTWRFVFYSDRDA